MWVKTHQGNIVNLANATDITAWPIAAWPTDSEPEVWQLRAWWPFCWSKGEVAYSILDEDGEFEIKAARDELIGRLIPPRPSIPEFP